MARQTREPGRFVTLRSGRVIFIPKGYKGRWADVRDKIKAGGGGMPTTAMKQVPGGGLREPTAAEKKGRLVARQRLNWEEAGLEPGDFGVESWDDIDPEVVEDIYEKAPSPKERYERKKAGRGAGKSARTKARYRRWEREGLEPGDFGVESWDDIDPEVVEDVVRRAG